MQEIDITELSAFKIGYTQNEQARTGVTVIICEKGGVCGVDISGGSPATRETQKLAPVFNNKLIHGICLSGGSSFGLAACDGVMQYLEEQGIGKNVGVTVVPRVVGASLFDLKVGDHRIRPDKHMGYLACQSAFDTIDLINGRYGAGCGASYAHGTKDGGVGYFAVKHGDLLVGAVAILNAIGDVGSDCIEDKILAEYNRDKDFYENTILIAILTNAKLSESEMTRVAKQGQNGIARIVQPAHTVYDGDVCFAISSAEVSATVDSVGILASRVVEQALLNAVS